MAAVLLAQISRTGRAPGTRHGPRRRGTGRPCRRGLRGPRRRGRRTTTEADRAEACLACARPGRRQREGRRPRCHPTPRTATRRRPPSRCRHGPGVRGPGRGDGRDRRRDDLGRGRCAARGPQRPVGPRSDRGRRDARRAHRDRPTCRRPPRQVRRDDHGIRRDRRRCAGRGATVRDRIDPWADREVNRAIELTRARAVLRAGSPADDPDTDFLCSILDHRIRHAETMALAAMAALGAPEAGGVIRRCLGSADPDVRAQAIEALDSIGDRRLGRSSPDCSRSRPRRARRCDDGAASDCAMMTTRGSATMARRLQPSGDDLTDTEPTPPATSRRCSCSGACRCSSGSRPRTSSASRRPRPSAGSRRTRRSSARATSATSSSSSSRARSASSHRAATAASGLLRTYEAGDHIGELAVLRERTARRRRSSPRAAASAALVIGGEGLRSILRERPDAAMAMLATLAERLSTSMSVER